MVGSIGQMGCGLVRSARVMDLASWKFAKGRPALYFAVHAADLVRHALINAPECSRGSGPLSKDTGFVQLASAIDPAKEWRV